MGWGGSNINIENYMVIPWGSYLAFTCSAWIRLQHPCVTVPKGHSFIQTAFHGVVGTAHIQVLGQAWVVIYTAGTTVARLLDHGLAGHS